MPGPPLAAGAEVHRGALEDLDSLRAARAADGVIHTAFIHDFSTSWRIARTTAGRSKRSAPCSKAPRRPSGASGWHRFAGPAPTEDDKPVADFPRISEEAADAVAARGVRASPCACRPRSTARRSRLCPAPDRLAREKGVSAYIGDGQNRWPGVIAMPPALYRLALERAAGGPVSRCRRRGRPLPAIAEVIGRHSTCRSCPRP